MSLAAIEFPPIQNVVEWPAIFGDGWYAFNKIALIAFIAMAAPTILFWIAGMRSALVPKGVQTFAEGIVGFVENQVAKPGIGPGYEPYLPVLISFFCFIAVGNLFEVIPFFQMPLNARMGAPLVLAIVAYLFFIMVGMKHNGPVKYMKAVAFPSGVPKFMYILVTPIELVSTFLVRPFSHAIRLFANMLAGHILLVSFGVLCIAVWQLQLLVVLEALTFPGLIVFTAFEIGVSLIQAFVFAILASVYIGGALHPEH